MPKGRGSTKSKKGNKKRVAPSLPKDYVPSDMNRTEIKGVGHVWYLRQLDYDARIRGVYSVFIADTKDERPTCALVAVTPEGVSTIALGYSVDLYVDLNNLRWDVKQDVTSSGTLTRKYTASKEEYDAFLTQLNKTYEQNR